MNGLLVLGWIVLAVIVEEGGRAFGKPIAQAIGGCMILMTAMVSW